MVLNKLEEVIIAERIAPYYDPVAIAPIADVDSHLFLEDLKCFLWICSPQYDDAKIALKWAKDNQKVAKQGKATKG